MSESKTSAKGASNPSRQDEIITALLAMAVEQNPSYLTNATRFASLHAEKEVSKSTVQNWFRPYLERAKELAAKSGGTPKPTPSKTPAKAKATPRKRKGEDNDNENEDEDDIETPVKSVKSAKGRKGTPKPKKMKSEEAEEDCILDEPVKAETTEAEESTR